MIYKLNKHIIAPRLYSCERIITDVNKEFIEFTGFRTDELLGKSLTEIGAMIRINTQMLLDNLAVSIQGIYSRSPLKQEKCTYHFLLVKKRMRKYILSLRNQIPDLMISLFLKNKH